MEDKMSRKIERLLHKYDLVHGFFKGEILPLLQNAGLTLYEDNSQPGDPASLLLPSHTGDRCCVQKREDMSPDPKNPLPRNFFLKFYMDEPSLHGTLFVRFAAKGHQDEVDGMNQRLPKPYLHVSFSLMRTGLEMFRLRGLSFVDIVEKITAIVGNPTLRNDDGTTGRRWDFHHVWIV